jgi:hypothetical protein
MLSVVTLNVVMLNVVVSNGRQYHVVMLSVVSTECHQEAPYAELFKIFYNFDIVKVLYYWKKMTINKCLANLLLCNWSKNIVSSYICAV